MKRSPGEARRKESGVAWAINHPVLALFVCPFIYDRRHLMRHYVILSLLFTFVTSGFSFATADLMDQYLSLPGSYQFVRHEPEGATPTRVRMTVFEDFLCPACYHTVTEVIPPLQEKYQERLEVHFVGYPLVHEASRLPARAYAIAQEMGLGKEMQHALFHAHFEEQLDTTSRGGLAKVADSIGLDPSDLLARLDKGDGTTEVARNLSLGESYHIDAVPGILFDGWILAKDSTPENLEKIIAGLLARKSRPAQEGKKASGTK